MEGAAGFFAKRRAVAALKRANRANADRCFASAVRDYRRYLAWDPANFDVWVQLGHMLAEQHAFDAAEAAYAMASGLRGDDADLLLCWGHLRRRMGDEDGARSYYGRSLEIDGNDRAERMLAELHIVDEAPPEPIDLPPEQPPAEETPEPVFAGRVDHADGRTISGWAFIGSTEQDDVEFRRDGVSIGHSPLIHPRGEGGYVFRSLLDIEGEAQVSVHRRSDGVELEGSPVTMHWAPFVDASRFAWSVPAEIVKPFVFEPGETALFVTHSATGLIKPHVLPYVRALADQGIRVLLIAVVDQPIELPAELLDLVAGAIVRVNQGYDFAAWAHGLRLHPELYGAARLYLVNDSVFGPSSGAAFESLITRVRGSDADLIGLTESQEHSWHLQSYFLVLGQNVLATSQIQSFFAEVRILDDKDAIIRAYELPLAKIVRDIGFRVETLFPLPLAVNPTLFGWRPLIEAGFPFVKLLLLRGAFPEADLTGSRDVLAAAGFDMNLLDLSVRAASEVLPQGADSRLLKPTASKVPARPEAPLKVALLGPWNYDSGLAAASRGLVASVRRTGVRLNLHPIRRPFHVHKPFTPPVDLRDFDGPADIALVHLNPDSWHLLTDEQRAIAWAADKRIGYWVWEMGHIPAAWWADWHSVDRIWSPSHYCADLFRAHTSIPVDVVPHAVPVLPALPSSRAEALEEIGVDPAHRVILYVFDGASYLVRKNPAGLVRGFAASGLAKRGWRLVLKTKHLMDRPGDGAKFRALAESVNGVVLIDRPMAPAKFRALLDAADIYASTHCSEGFGLTIAEAMVAGKPVIATDFGGSRDFLDAASGYPVKAHPWVLEEDFEHYTRGGEWARVDEPALAATLVSTADAVEAGTESKGAIARERIAAQLSFEHIGERIGESFRATMEGHAPSPAGPAGRQDQFRGFDSRFATALPADRLDYDPRLAVVQLAEDGSADPVLSALPADFPADRDHWVVIVPANARLHPLLDTIVERQARDRPDVAIFYGDDAANVVGHSVDQIRLKPAFDLSLLAANDYIGTPLIVRASAFAALDGLRAEAGTAATMDLVLRAHGQGMSIERITEVLLGHPGRRPVATLEDRASVLAGQPFLDAYDVVPGRIDGSLMLRRRFDAAAMPPITIVIPTCRSTSRNGDIAHIQNLLEQLAQVDWPMDRLTVLVGDDQPGLAEWAERKWPFTLRHVHTARAPDAPFNYAAKMNQLWRLAESELVVMMNDDIRIPDHGWLKALATFAMDDGVGGVGARLLYEDDGRIAHVGIIPHLAAICHAWLSRRPEHGSYQDWADLQREWSMVTGAVFATRKSVLEEVNGFDEAFTVEYNDVDLSLRIRALGYRIVLTPDAELVHYEKASRGHTVPHGDQLALFLQRWRSWLDNDPSWHPALRRDLIDVEPQDDPGAWYRF